MKFTYRWGQRPLEGFTIKRGLGQGGFGEVYFAISDGGKEVALKMLYRGRTETELRGIANCLNFKHPNLVHLYDLKTDERGDHWLAMEYVQGESLSSVLNRHPNGLPTNTARDYFLQVAEAVAYLHDRAVIHRDIKPANVFIESGILKLGDYGLSKTVGPSQLQQSANVGTVYYMAPEVARGESCTKQVDIYALGIVLFEMLTGDIPFKGESWAEVAMRQQTDTPDLSRAPKEYISVLEKCLHKKPEKRYGDVLELIKAVKQIGTSANFQNNDEAKDMLLQERTPVIETQRPRAVPPPIPTRKPNSPAPIPMATPVATTTPPPIPIPTGAARLGELSWSMFLAPIAGLVAVGVWALVSYLFVKQVDWYAMAPFGVLTTLIAWVVLPVAKFRENRKFPVRGWFALLGIPLALVAFWMEGWSIPKLVTGDSVNVEHTYFNGNIQATPGAIEHLVGHMLLFCGALSMIRWGKSVRRRRDDRFSTGRVIGAGVTSFILWFALWTCLPFYNASSYNFLAFASAAAVVQMVSPWVATARSEYRKEKQKALAA